MEQRDLTMVAQLVSEFELRFILGPLFFQKHQAANSGNKINMLA